MTTNNMKLLEADSSNWNLYLDDRGWIWYIAKEGSGCKSGYWGNARHYKRMYGKDIQREHTSLASTPNIQMHLRMKKLKEGIPMQIICDCCQEDTTGQLNHTIKSGDLVKTVCDFCYQDISTLKKVNGKWLEIVHLDGMEYLKS